MAETASGDNARIGRRALSEDPFEAAANVVKSLTAGANAAGADAAASAAGTAAGKQFKSFTDTLLHPVDATPPPSTTPPATTSVAAPPLAASQLVRTASIPVFMYLRMLQESFAAAFQAGSPCRLHPGRV